MADLSQAEVMLNNSTKIKPLIKRLQSFLKVMEPPRGIDLSRHTKANIAAFQNDLQRYIDELATQREKLLELVKQIPDQSAQEVLLMRYGLTGSGREMPWTQLEMQMNYSPSNLFRYHRKGIDYLNQLLENGG